MDESENYPVPEVFNWVQHNIVGTRHSKKFPGWDKTYFSLSPYPLVDAKKNGNVGTRHSKKFPGWDKTYFSLSPYPLVE
ncbi:hypothetical protein [Microseira wollei]|uniref:Uncharacterized protein n=1 Tax=Microseira wollei NIES-4236 TaxID=2530354 RepID=A0AAV3X0X6_9CYAN|nr:hypothetical protein [Microseira wollei]GET35420.1 hypothetical protein MiSe_01620 [Microseira wollei NIES-4236]